MPRQPAQDLTTAALDAQPVAPWTVGNRLIGFDLEHYRVWIGGQRLHHGATGVALATATLARLLVSRRSARQGLPWVLAAGAMVAHDWKDRAVWFRRGPQSD
jgi:hypothetical protein